MIRKYISGPLDPGALQDLTTLVEESPDIAMIEGWIHEQRLEVEHWADREHLDASDNSVPRLPWSTFLGRQSML